MPLRPPRKKYVGPHVLERRRVRVQYGLGPKPTATRWICKYCGASSSDPDELAPLDCNEFESAYPDDA